ncbi:hypothetical protein [Micromonospora matsumotoense]|uniref:hypothetical protein n=1 Tax=Micromonospora matsumotoense TaxID=121616 RepID=UPI00114CE637|nr:hypothetical protein [Micromonospora matsumotoense]
MIFLDGSILEDNGSETNTKRLLSPLVTAVDLSRIGGPRIADPHRAPTSVRKGPRPVAGHSEQVLSRVRPGTPSRWAVAISARRPCGRPECFAPHPTDAYRA